MASARGTTRLLAASILLLALAPLAQAQTASSPSPIAKAPDGRPLYQWNSSESWPGGTQHDPRLDQPVHFWRAGISLSEVFSSLTDHTGVKLGFFPEGDENARVRVNLYLNLDQPPTLRDLMAQLAWVTDSALAYAGSAEGEPGPRYYLLATSIGRAPMEIGIVQERARQRVSEATQPDQGADPRAEVRANLEKLRQALQLPRDELIARYKGVDDHLLFTLTNLRRRAAAEYICGVIGEGDELPDSDTWSERRWDELSAEEQRLVSAAWRLTPESVRARAGGGDTVVLVAFQPSVDPAGPALSLAGGVRGPGPNVGAKVMYGYPDADCVAPTRARALLELERLSPEAAAGFLRGIGEEVPEGGEHVRVDDWKTALSQRRHREKLEALVAGAALSPTTAQALASLELPVEGGSPYALWELQEAVAAASGLNIASDCFWQPRRSLYDTHSALLALASACHAWTSRAQELYDPVWLAGWEWGDAGSFLRFRSIDRDVWRASLLPDETVAQLDEHLSSFLPEEAEAEWPPGGFSLSLHPDVLQLIRIAGRLRDLQLAYGARLVYADPSDPAATCLDALREAFLALVTGNHDDAVQATRDLNAFRIMASLNEEQWERTRSSGLPGKEMTEDQVALLPKALDPGTWVSYRDDLSATLLKAGDYMGPEWDRAEKPLWFYCALVDPKALDGVLPEGHSMDLRLFEWRCPPRVEVRVPRPLRPALQATQWD